MRADRDSALFPRCIDGIEQHVAQRACECAIVAEHAWKILVYLQIESNTGRNAAARSVANELAHVDFRGWALRKSPKLGETFRHAIEALTLYGPTPISGRKPWSKKAKEKTSQNREGTL